MVSVRAPALVAVAILTGTVAIAGQPGEFSALLHIGFDGTASAESSGPEVAVAGAEQLAFGEGRAGQAGDFTGAVAVEYRPLPRVDPGSGTLELWIKSLHDGKEMSDHPYLRFESGDSAAGMEVRFYHVECSAQVTIWGNGRRFSRYGWGWQRDTWQHLVVTWRSGDAEGSGLGLYLNGTETGYPAAYEAVAVPEVLRVGAAKPPEATSSMAWIDEVTVYSSALTAGQAKALFAAAGRPLSERVAAVRQRLAADEAFEQQRHDLLFNQRRVGMIHGRVQSLVNWPDSTFAALRIPVPEKIHETALATADLSRYDTLFVAGGGGLNLADAGKEALREYVRKGGGYVGICGGAVSAAEAGLIAATRYRFGARGPVFAKLLEHPVTEGYDLSRTILFPHASGPLFVIREGSGEVPVVLFDVGEPPLPTFVNAIAKEYGKGRVLIFSGHPEGSVQTRRLLRNAILWTTRISGAESGSPAR